MNIFRAEHLGMCFGVRDAIGLAIEQARQGPLTVLGDLVHNETVLAELRWRGVQVAPTLAEVRTQNLMITAHGASERAIAAARQQGHAVAEATCPLVHLAHRALRQLVKEGYHPVVIGQRQHVEVRGLTGDLDQFEVILSESDVYELPERRRFGLVAQTTQPVERVRQLAALVRGRFPQSEVKLVDTVCQPTKQRQHAAVELAQHCDLVLVIGGAGSNNTRELVNTCRQYCRRVHHIQTAADLCPDWFAGIGTVGITAGTSTPDRTIDEVEGWLQRLRESCHAAQTL